MKEAERSARRSYLLPAALYWGECFRRYRLWRALRGREVVRQVVSALPDPVTCHGGEG